MKDFNILICMTFYLKAIREDGMPGGRNKSIGPVQVMATATF
jgi:hypothetical protein